MELGTCIIPSAGTTSPKSLTAAYLRMYLSVERARVIRNLFLKKKKKSFLWHKKGVKWVKTGSVSEFISSFFFTDSASFHNHTVTWRVFNANLCQFLCINNCGKQFWNWKIEYSWEMHCQSYIWLQNLLFAIFQQLRSRGHLILFLFTELNGLFS